MFLLPPNPTGQVSGGYIVLLGPVTKAKLVHCGRKNPNGTLYYDDWKIFRWSAAVSFDVEDFSDEHELHCICVRARLRAPMDPGGSRVALIEGLLLSRTGPRGEYQRQG